MADTRPVKLAPIESPRCEPDTHTVMHQNLHPVSATIGDKKSTVRLRRTEHGDHFGLRRLCASAHIQRLSGQQMASIRITGLDHG